MESDYEQFFAENGWSKNPLSSKHWTWSIQIGDKKCYLSYNKGIDRVLACIDGRWVSVSNPSLSVCMEEIKLKIQELKVPEQHKIHKAVELISSIIENLTIFAVHER